MTSGHHDLVNPCERPGPPQAIVKLTDAVVHKFTPDTALSGPETTTGP